MAQSIMSNLPPTLLTRVMDPDVHSLQAAKDQRTVLQKILDFILGGRYCANRIEALWATIRKDDRPYSVSGMIGQLYALCETNAEKALFREQLHIDCKAGEWHLCFRRDDTSHSVLLGKGNIPVFMEFIAGSYSYRMPPLSSCQTFLDQTQSSKDQVTHHLCNAILEANTSQLTEIIKVCGDAKNDEALTFLAMQAQSLPQNAENSHERKECIVALLKACVDTDNDDALGVIMSRLSCSEQGEDILEDLSEEYVQKIFEACMRIRNDDALTYLLSLPNVKEDPIMHAAEQCLNHENLAWYVKCIEKNFPRDWLEYLRANKSPALYHWARFSQEECDVPIIEADVERYASLPFGEFDTNKRAECYACAGNIAYVFGHRERAEKYYSEACRLDDTYKARSAELTAFYSESLRFDESLGNIWCQAVDMICEAEKPIRADSIEEILLGCEDSKSLQQQYQALSEKQKLQFNRLRDLMDFARVWPKFLNDAASMQISGDGAYCGLNNRLFQVPIEDSNIDTIIARYPRSETVAQALEDRLGSEVQAVSQALLEIPEITVSTAIPESAFPEQAGHFQYSFLCATAEGKERDIASYNELRNAVLAEAKQRGLIQTGDAEKEKTAAKLFMQRYW